MKRTAGEGFAYACWLRDIKPDSTRLDLKAVEAWSRIAVRDWWWCSGCYDWHWSPVGKKGDEK